MPEPDISINLCTYFRSDGLRKCLESLIAQQVDQTYEIVVVDNDEAGSAREVVEEFQRQGKSLGIDIVYDIEPEQNIAVARNRGIANSRGQYIALIDDDEWADPDWLQQMFESLQRNDVDGVWAPVIQVFPQDFPEWAHRLPFFAMTSLYQMKDGEPLSVWGTGNCLIRRDVFEKRPGPFDEHFGKSGGSDAELSRWLIGHGGRFCMASHRGVYELQPKSRATLRWNCRRQYRYGYTESLINKRHFGFVYGCLRSLRVAFRSFLGTLVRSLPLLSSPRAFAPFFIVRLFFIAGVFGSAFQVSIIEYKRK